MQEARHLKPGLLLEVRQSLLELIGKRRVGEESGGQYLNEALGETGIGNALIGRIAVGIRMADLRRKSKLAESAEEWKDITGRIHDGIADSAYSLSLLIEAYAATIAGNVHTTYRQIAGTGSTRRTSWNTHSHLPTDFPRHIRLNPHQ